MLAQKGEGNSYFDVDEIVSLIHYFVETDDTENLKSVIETGYSLHPGDVHFKITLSQTLADMGNYDSALKMIEDLHIQGNKEIDLTRIECYCELDRYDEFVGLIRTLAERDVSYLEEAVAHAACILNDIEPYWEKAHVFITNALNLFPDNIELKAELCYNYELRGKIKEAFVLCRKLIDEAPFMPEIWYAQGRLYSMCADFVHAVDSFDFAITCLEDNPDLEREIKLMRAFCLYKNGSYDEAIAGYLELLRGASCTTAQINPFLADCYISINEYETAYGLLKEIIGETELDDEVAVYGNFIYCCIETDRQMEAIEALSEALKRFPNSILEFITRLNILKGRQPEDRDGEEEKLIYPDELIRKYFSQNYHNN